ncbi:hypothetical protein QYE76_013618 [Lolium multiflorum]|uniref:Retrotransposon gag domain-containing protein n=1 Tax=Lolium multiflorum TaxID=4521 RepID=A0AAD8TZ62_LOLMU|nr:hypothetical protein QYE76_013618 [Lolium multiflorum]
MAEEQITYEDLPPDHKKKYDELKAIVEAELIGSFEKTRSHGIRRSRLHREGLPEQEQLFGRERAAAGSLGAEGETSVVAKYTTAGPESSAATTSTEIRSARPERSFGILPKKKIIGYSKPCPNEFDLIHYRLSTGFRTSVEWVGRVKLHRAREPILARLGMVSMSDQLRVRFFSQSLTGPAFGWYTSLQPNSVQSWKQLEELFHTQYHSKPESCVIQNCQDKFKRAITLVNADEDEDSAEDQEVAVAEWTRTPVPVSCKWVNPPGPPRGLDFDVTKTEQIFDLLLKEKQLKLPEGHKIPTAQEMNKRPYCKWHHTFTHATNDCKVLRAQIQMAIESGRLTFGQFAMKVDMRPFPDVNMVDLSHSIREPGFSFDVNMAGFVIRHGVDKAESSHSRGKDKEEAVPRDRPQDDDRRYLTEEEVRSTRYQRPLSVHLLNKYEQQYDRRRRYDDDDGGYRRSMQTEVSSE